MNEEKNLTLEKAFSLALQNPQNKNLVMSLVMINPMKLIVFALLNILLMI